MLEIKRLNNGNIATTQMIGHAQDIQNSVADRIKSNLWYMKCPTNFKIEPGHFRVEKKKETLNDRYIIEDIIGQGKFGVVKRIRDKESKLHRAIKIINKASCQEIDNLVDEIKIIKSLVSFEV
jgi:serine/threonine protein kinase